MTDFSTNWDTTGQFFDPTGLIPANRLHAEQAGHYICRVCGAEVPEDQMCGRTETCRQRAETIQREISNHMMGLRPTFGEIEEVLERLRNERAPDSAHDEANHSNCIPRDQLEAIIAQLREGDSYSSHSLARIGYIHAINTIKELIDAKWGEYVQL